MLRAICPSCLHGGGKSPCAGYSGFSLELRPLGLLVREEARYAMHTPANCRPFGRSDRPVAALSAVAICDAMSIGFLKQVAETVLSGSLH